MEFAVVEYSSKSGTVWQHTDAKPNYLCDPNTEMDTTSFGCYVSALKGKHIPLTEVVGANKIINRVIRKLSGSWPDNYSLDDFDGIDVLMVVYEVANGSSLIQFMKRIRKVYPKVKILGVPTQPYGLLKPQWDANPDTLKELQEFISNCDVFLTIVADLKDTWQKLSSVPVHYLAQPYPLEHASLQFQPLEKKQDIIYVPGVTDRPIITRGLEVARELQKRLPQYKIHVTKNEDADFSALGEAKYEEIDFLPWQEHLKYLSGVKLVINTDYTKTRGRVQMDCAAVGTPSVGADSDSQLDLYPEFAATSESTVSEIVELAYSLLSNSDQYIKTTEFATSKLPFYNYVASASRLADLVKSV
jgi:hypothetical protein